MSKYRRQQFITPFILTVACAMIAVFLFGAAWSEPAPWYWKIVMVFVGLLVALMAYGISGDIEW